MVGWIRNRTRTIVKRYLNENTFKLLQYGYFAINKRPGTTCAEELEDVKVSIVQGIKEDVEENEQFLLRAGHGGILDSMATGVLVVALCDGCKVLPHMLKSSKRYLVTAKLGIATDTYNNTGNIVNEKPYDHVTRPTLEKALEEFVGEIWQKPPVYSALKISGKRASDIVRAGGEVEMVTRPVTCHIARCLEFEPPFFKLDVSCGHGFYVRTLIHDLTLALGSCGHITALERTKHGPFTLKDCIHPDDFSLENIVLAVSEARKNYPKLGAIIDEYWNKVGSDEMKENLLNNYSFKHENQLIRRERKYNNSEGFDKKKVKHKKQINMINNQNV